MYALVTLWQLAEAPADGRLPQLEPPIAALVHQWPGFVGGYWTYEHANGKSVGFVLLETSEHAHDLRNALEHRMESQDHPTLWLEMIRVQKIMARVPAGVESPGTG